MHEEGRRSEEVVRSASAFSVAGPGAMAELVAAAGILKLRSGEYLFRDGEPCDAVYLVVDGELESFSLDSDSKAKTFARFGPGELVGETQIITGGRRDGDVLARGRAELVRISCDGIRRAIEREPRALDELVKVARRRLQRVQAKSALRRLFNNADDRAIDALAARAEWLHVPRGEVLIRTGDSADCLYVVVSGRLQVYVDDGDGNERVLGQIGQGETAGEMALLVDERRTANVKVLRDCNLARLGRNEFVAVAREYPAIVVTVARGLIERVRSGITDSTKPGHLRTFAITAASDGLSVQPLAEKFAEEISKLGTTRLVDHASAGTDLGLDTRQMTVEHSQSVLLSAWLAEQEARYDYVLLVAEGSATPWTECCFRAADMVLLVGDATADPEPREIETELLASVANATSVPTTLLLLHEADTTVPTGTALWLRSRRINGHYHLRRGRQDDVARVARLLTGNAVGLVLGGGGARGAAHIGVIRALRESGIPIDVIGGTSSGGGIAAQYAMSWADKAILDENIEGFVRNNPFRRLTFPLFSIIDRKKMDATAREMFGDRQIEDLWIDFFCVSCNLNKGEAVVHRQGPLWKAVRATSSLPGVAVPVVQDGELLVDGGVVDNLPGLIMRRLIGGHIVVVDVSPDEGMSVDIDYADVPGPWRGVWNRLNPFGKRIRFPTMMHVLLRTVSVSSLANRERALEDADLVLRPPVDRYGMLDFSATAEIAASAYDYTMEHLRNASQSTLKRLARGQSG